MPEEYIEQSMVRQIKPLNFLGKNSAEIKYERDYEELCIKLQTFTPKDIRKISVKEFYALLDYAKKESRPKSATRARHR